MVEELGCFSYLDLTCLYNPSRYSSRTLSKLGEFGFPYAPVQAFRTLLRGRLDWLWDDPVMSTRVPAPAMMFLRLTIYLFGGLCF